MQALEQLVSEVKKEDRYKTIDIYTSGAIELYTGYLGGPPGTVRPAFGPIGQQTTLPRYGIGGPKLIEGPGSICRNQYDLDYGWKLQERFDFSGHGKYGPHINYDLINPSGSVIKDSPSILGDMHQTRLDKFF